MKRGGPLRRRTALKRGGPPLRRTALKPSPEAAKRHALAASDAQRTKVAGQPCLVCARRTRVDPAHLIPRSLGGCDEPECVVPLCRAHHRAYDRGALDLLPYLEPGRRVELAHAVCHLGLIGALRRISGRRSPG